MHFTVFLLLDRYLRIKVTTKTSIRFIYTVNSLNTVFSFVYTLHIIHPTPIEIFDPFLCIYACTKCLESRYGM